jgi:hypothetical protein
MKENKHYMWQSVKGTTRIDIDETLPKTNKGKRDLVKDMIQRKKRELIVAFIGYIIGMGIGVWVMIQMVLFGISK